MKKVKENVDLSKQVLEIDIESPVFNSMLHDTNKEIKRVMQKVYDEEFESGEITIKLNLTILDDYKEFPKTNEFGELVNELYRYKRPRFEHKVTTTLKKQFKQDGLYTEEKEIQFVDGEYIAVPIENPQLGMDDYLKEVK